MQVLLQYYTELLQYYFILQSTSPVLLRTTKYYSSNPVPQNTSPVLFCTTKYYSSTTSYYTVLVQYSSVLQSTTPILQNESAAYSSAHMKSHLQCAEQHVSRSNLTKYCACQAERFTYLIVITYETSFTMRGATGVTIQPHQILRLSRRKTQILCLHRI